MRYIRISIVLMVVLFQMIYIPVGAFAASGGTVNSDVVSDDALENQKLLSLKLDLEKEIQTLQEQLDAASTLRSTLKSTLNELMNQKYTLEFQSLQMAGEELFRPWAEEQQRLIRLKSDIEDQRYILQKEIEDLNNQYKSVKSTATSNELAALTASIRDKEQAYKAIPEVGAVLEDLKVLMLNLYSDADRKRFESLNPSLQRQGLRAIPVNHVFFYRKNVKMDLMPVIAENGQVMVPIRVIATYTGLDVSWDPDKQEVNLSNAKAVLSAGSMDYVIEQPPPVEQNVPDMMPIYDFNCKVGQPFELGQAPAQIICGRTFIPLSAVESILGSLSVRVEWEPETNTLTFR